MHPRLTSLVLTMVLVLCPVRAPAQETYPTQVRVRQVAGGTVYLDLGVRHGLAPGDTLATAREPDGPVVGYLTVTAATDVRSVLAFVGDPFPVTRGEVLVLHLLRAAAEPAPEVQLPPTGARPSPRTPAARPAPGARRPAHGRIALDVAMNHSSTRFGGADAVSVGRTFATPALRFNVTAPHAVGGFTFRTSARMAYRYSSLAPMDQPASARIYTASLDRTFDRVPLRVSLGRFSSPAESYSGFWDGLFLRLGGRDAGIGALVGFEPDRWNETPSVNRPKVSAFADVRRGGEGWRWQADLSAHAVRPTDSLPDHTFLGLSQRLSAGPLRLTQDAQVDRDTDGSWRVGRLRARAYLTLAPGVEMHAGFLRREQFRPWSLDALFSPRRDRIDGGLSYRWPGGSLRGTVSTSRDETGEQTWGYSGVLDADRLPGLSGAGGSTAVSMWSGAYGRTVTVAPAVDFDVARSRWRVGYRMYYTDYLARTGVTHGLEGSVETGLGPALRMSARFRTQWGGGLRSDAVQLTLYRVF